jgi:tRNA-2-methylthio-N6-dimethylallyladenosine synthase
MDGAIAEEEKARRLIEVQALQREVTEAVNARLVGTQVELLVEGTSRRSEAEFTGRTRTNKIVNFTTDVPPAPGDFVTVEITGAGFLSLHGRQLARVAAAGSSAR